MAEQSFACYVLVNGYPRKARWLGVPLALGGLWALVTGVTGLSTHPMFLMHTLVGVVLIGFGYLKLFGNVIMLTESTLRTGRTRFGGVNAAYADIILVHPYARYGKDGDRGSLMLHYFKQGAIASEIVLPVDGDGFREALAARHPSLEADDAGGVINKDHEQRVGEILENLVGLPI